jgi:hypothetical protein
VTASAAVYHTIFAAEASIGLGTAALPGEHQRPPKTGEAWRFRHTYATLMSNGFNLGFHLKKL